MKILFQFWENFKQFLKEYHVILKKMSRNNF